MPGVLLFIDFEKAFDSIEWPFLYKILEVFNYATSSVINNGLCSRSFRLERSVRQGDPLSPYLFLVAIEILALSLRSSRNVVGIKIGNDEFKTLLYADDMTLTLANSSSVESAIQILNNYEKCSGMKMSLSKTKAMWTGRCKNSSDKPLGLDWCTGVKTLGFTFPVTERKCLRRILTVRLTVFKKRSIYGD